MVLANKKSSCNINTMVAASLALSFLSLFIATWQSASLHQLTFEAMISLTIAALVAIEVKNNRGHLIHGAIMVVTTLPWVFYLLLITLAMLVF